jgi:NlpC/P60 family putative phage cell wall peptidase
MPFYPHATAPQALVSRARIVALARRWIGTPYHHQASRLGVGVDCLGLVRGVWRSLHGTEPEPLPGYARDWAEATGQETLVAAARRHLVEIDKSAARPGDVLVFRYRSGSVAKHVGILSSPLGDPCPCRSGTIALAPAPHVAAFIHAVEGAPVAEVALIGWWRRRIAAAFSFPGVID